MGVVRTEEGKDGLAVVVKPEAMTMDGPVGSELRTNDSSDIGVAHK